MKGVVSIASTSWRDSLITSSRINEEILWLSLSMWLLDDDGSLSFGPEVQRGGDRICQR